MFGRSTGLPRFLHDAGHPVSGSWGWEEGMQKDANRWASGSTVEDASIEVGTHSLPPHLLVGVWGRMSQPRLR